MVDDFGFSDPHGDSGLKLLGEQKRRELDSARFAARQRKLARGDRPRFGLMRRIVRVIRGGGD